MSMVMEEKIKRWTAKRKSVQVFEALQGKTTVADAGQGARLAGGGVILRQNTEKPDFEI